MQSFPRGWTGADIVFLDCDSTLSAVEGIDELASRNGSDVATLTTDAMAGRVTMESVYRRRLELIDPGTDDLIWLADRYAGSVAGGDAAAATPHAAFSERGGIGVSGRLPARDPRFP